MVPGCQDLPDLGGHSRDPETGDLACDLGLAQHDTTEGVRECPTLRTKLRSSPALPVVLGVRTRSLSRKRARMLSSPTSWSKTTPTFRRPRRQARACWR